MKAQNQLRLLPQNTAFAFSFRPMHQIHRRCSYCFDEFFFSKSNRGWVELMYIYKLICLLYYRINNVITKNSINRIKETKRRNPIISYHYRPSDSILSYVILGTVNTSKYLTLLNLMLTLQELSQRNVSLSCHFPCSLQTANAMLLYPLSCTDFYNWLGWSATLMRKEVCLKSRRVA